VPSHQADGPRAELSHHEWAAVDAVRSTGESDHDGRRLLAQAAENLRIASLDPGPVPVDVIAEDDVTFVFLAPAPMGGMPGHTLVATRRHVETIFDLTGAEGTALGLAVVAAARAVRAALGPAGVLIQQNNGVAACQTVPHIHFHVIPKVPGPFPPAQPPELMPYEERAKLAERLSRHWPLVE